MNFNKIDVQTWNRKNSYNQFLVDTPCTYSMTVNLDATNLIKTINLHQLKFFATILYGISHTINRHSKFRMDFDEEGNVGFYDVSNPCYAVFHEQTDTFTNVWTEYDEDFNVFIKNYNNDIQKYQNDSKNSKPIFDKNIFMVSCIPWVSFTGFNLNLQKGYCYLSPIITIGKHFPMNDKMFLPLAIQMHHAVCDGYHIAKFINDLQKWVNTFEV